MRESEAIKALQSVADYLHLIKYSHVERLAIIKDCNKQLEKLVIKFKAWSADQRKAFVNDDNVAIILYQIFDAILGYTAKTYYKSLIRANRSNVDQLFGVFKVSAPTSYFNYLPTRIFTEMCKGITYFEGDDVTERPIYHRPASCGTRYKDFEQKFKVPIGATTSQKLAIHRATRLCYLERLIYDKVYNQVLHHQDVEHMQELKNMERLFQDYYPGDEVEVVVKLDDVFELVVTTNRTFEKVIETYRKKKWNDAGDIFCLKEVTGSNAGEWIKHQKFEKEMPWRAVKREIRSASAARSMASRQRTTWGGK